MNLTNYNLKQLFTCLAILGLTMLFTDASAQLKVGDNPTTINGDALLEMESTNKGMLLPRVALTATTVSTPLSAHVSGMTVYNTATAGDVTPGFYYNDGTKWVRLADAEVADPTQDAWIDVVGTRVELGTLSNGTARPAGTEFVALDNGNVGIGRVSPRTALDVVRANTLSYSASAATSSANSTTILENSDNTTDNFVSLRLRSGSADGSIAYVNRGTNIGDMVFNTDGSTNGAERMRIMNNGNVGIGTDNPTNTLDINGKTRVRDLTGADTATDVLVTADAITGELKEGGTLASALAAAGVDESDDAWVDNATDGRVELGLQSDGSTARSTGTELVVLDNGNVGIGTVNPAAKLVINTSSTNQVNIFNGSTGPAVRFSEDNGVTQEASIQFRNSTVSPINYPNSLAIFSRDSNDIWLNAHPGNPDLWVDGDNGFVGIGNTDPTNALDVNGKTRVRDLTGADTATDVLVTADAITGELKEGGTLASALAAAGVDESDDAWVDNASSGRIELGSQSDGSTARTTGTEFVVLDNGNTGIGRVSPRTALDVVRANTVSYSASAATSSASSTTILENSDNTTDNFVSLRLRSGSADGSIAYINKGTNDGDMVFNTDGGASGVERMRIMNNGNVGIGTIDPGSKLSVVGLPAFASVVAAQASATISAGDFYVLDSSNTDAERSVVRIKF